MNQYAGQELLTGAQAEIYANNFINVHLSEIGAWQTYSQLSTAAQADPTNAKLAGEVATIFKGTTLRSMLLNAYGWGEIGISPATRRSALPSRPLRCSVPSSSRSSAGASQQGRPDDPRNNAGEARLGHRVRTTSGTAVPMRHERIHRPAAGGSFCAAIDRRGCPQRRHQYVKLRRARRPSP